ncbi:MAG: NAD(P)(+) transhydrogenase (Re/Si-specific) subunit alpha, partial [Pseudomonadota bacterium]
MPTIGTPKETAAGENRVAMTPQSVKDLAKLGFDALIETGAGVAAGFSDAAYTEAGAKVAASDADLWATADIVAKVRPPSDEEADKLRDGQTLISFFYPNENKELMTKAADAG